MTTEALTGYDGRKSLLAQRFLRAGKHLYVIALPLHLVPTHLPIPDPERRFEGNRTVDRAHATAFGVYWRENAKWATPPLLLDTTFPIGEEFEARESIAGVEFGVVYLPHNSADELQILDGQHRILGWTLASRAIHQELKKVRDAEIVARDRGDVARATEAAKEVARLRDLQQRFQNEYVTVEILEGVSMQDHKQYFHDIATNAKGITKSLTASFDKRRLVNRVAMAVAETHPLLRGRVDFEKPSATGVNPNVISGRNLVDVITALQVGMGRTLSTMRERELTDESAVAVTEGFFDALCDEFSDLADVRDGGTFPVQMRSQSLLGSPTVLRVLAGTYYELAVEHLAPAGRRVNEDGDASVRRLFRELAPHMGLPLGADWFSTGFFPTPTAKAPLSNAQTLKGMSALLTGWGRAGAVPFGES